MNFHIMNLRLLVAIILILFISTNTVAALTLTKTVSTESSRYKRNTILYDYVLTNDNGTDLHDVVFTDDRLGSIPSWKPLAMAIPGLNHQSQDRFKREYAHAIEKQHIAFG